MGRADVQGRLRIGTGQEGIAKTTGETVTAAHAVLDLEALEARALIESVVLRPDVLEPVLFELRPQLVAKRRVAVDPDVR